jgi:hypothetical protein
MTTKFGSFLTENKIDPRRILVASHHIESLRVEDRAIRLASRLARKSEDGPKKDADRKKPRSGRPVTQRALDAALKGTTLAGPQKTRLVRAVNAILEQKKQPVIDIRALF